MPGVIATCVTEPLLKVAVNKLAAASPIELPEKVSAVLPPL